MNANFEKLTKAYTYFTSLSSVYTWKQYLALRSSPIDTSSLQRELVQNPTNMDGSRNALLEIEKKVFIETFSANGIELKPI